ncbi:MAG TPA: sigma-70 family RNA polymerase sigma factor, partial [Acidimicrobiales bacterium]|nr:sigma-70 family RNA polymerase sigma factor [Acidimicrobiales bacterium]
RRRTGLPDDEEGVSEPVADVGDARAAVLELYDAALPHVYGYLLSRCGRPSLAEELTAETFLAAVDAARRDDPPVLSVPWVLGVARHKLVDHWRRQARDDRNLRALAGDAPPAEDPWDVRLDVARARQTLERLGPQHRAALTLRYLDDLPVAQVAELLERTLHATEALLVRARAAFRRAYGEESCDG